MGQLDNIWGNLAIFDQNFASRGVPDERVFNRGVSFVRRNSRGTYDRRRCSMASCARLAYADICQERSQESFT
jgi:hypothetical protein